MSILDTLNAEELAQVEKIKNTLEPELSEIVRIIEQKPKTTRGHYGDYMSAFARLNMNTNSKEDRTMRAMVALAMIQLGGNEDGILSAHKVMS